MIERDLERIATTLELISKQLAAMLPPVITVTTMTETAATPPAPEKKAPKAKAEKASAPVTEKPAEPAKAQESPKAPEAPKPEPAKAPTNDQKPYTLETIRGQILAVQQAKGADVAKKIVQTIGNAPQLSKIDPSKYDAVMAACQEAMNNG